MYRQATHEELTDSANVWLWIGCTLVIGAFFLGGLLNPIIMEVLAIFGMLLVLATGLVLSQEHHMKA